jgi:hypothetical protein
MAWKACCPVVWKRTDSRPDRNGYLYRLPGGGGRYR